MAILAECCRLNFNSLWGTTIEVTCDIVSSRELGPSTPLRVNFLRAIEISITVATSQKYRNTTMSDSELSDAPLHAIPSDATLETELRRVVRDALKQDEDITVRLARARVEEQLGLEADFFTKDEWKKRSKDIITAAVDEPDSPVKVKPTAGRKRKSEEPAQKPTKRAKKSAVVKSEDDDDDKMNESMSEEVVESDEEEEEKPKRKPRAQAKVKPQPKPRAKPKAKAKAKAKSSSPVIESDEEEDEENNAPKSEPETKAATTDSEAEDEQPQTNETSETIKPDEDDEKATSPAKLSEPADEDNDSDMSVLIDDPPPKKKGGRAKKSTSPGTAAKKPAKTTKKAAATTASSKELSPDEEEIKRLQSWLLKCGIRKLWHRELADDKFPTSKAKIAHLKSMLTDAGMTGRFSAEKAKSIKEARELEAELEAARDFEQQFGTGGRGRRAKKNAPVKDQGSDDDEDGDAGEQEDGEKAEGVKRPGGRLLPKGLVDFGDSGDDGSD
jgi:hypothetical protein